MSGTNTATLNAGEYRVYDGGNAWEIISSSQVMQVESIKDGRTIRKDDFAEVGSYDRYQHFYGADVRAFDAVKVTALTNGTTFTISISDGQSGKNLVASEVERIVQPVNVAELAGSRLETLGAIDPYSVAGLTVVAGQPAIGGTDTILSPAANVNGVVIETCVVWAWDIFISLKTSTPASTTDGLTLAACDYATSGYNSWANTTKTRLPVVVPAGMGIYAMVAAGSIGAGRYNIGYRAL